MKVKSSLIAPIIAASVLLPTTGIANTITADNTKQSSTTNASTQEKQHQENHNENGRQHEGEKDTERQKEIMAVVNQYAPAQLKEKLTNDFATREQLEQELRSKLKTPAGQDSDENEQNEQNEHAVQGDKEGNEQNEHAVQGDKDGNELNKHALQKELETAIQKKDSTAIVSALEKLDKQLENANSRLAQKIASIK